MSERPRLAPASFRAGRVLLWCDTTSRQTFETGIQRVTRRLGAGLSSLGVDLVMVGWDRRQRLAIDLASRSPVVAEPGRDTWFLLPEIPASTLHEGIDPIQLGRALGLRTAAVVHDLIPLKRPQDYDEAALQGYRRYFPMLAGADRIFTTTQGVAQDFRLHVAAGARKAPDVRTVPLPAQFAATSRRGADAPDRAGRILRLLAVSTWEPRKNLRGLLRAVRRAAEDGTRIHLTLVGRRGSFPAHDAAILDLLAGMPYATARERTTDRELALLHADHHATVYPSIEEGFGLPVLESLWLGRPCLCHEGSAMAEVAPGGGTVLVDMRDEAAVAAALTRLAADPDTLGTLAAEIRTRPLRDWSDYARDIAAQLDLTTRSG